VTTASAGWRPTASIAILRQRARALAVARNFFAERRVLECETPAIVSHPVSDPQLQNVQCGLAVRPGIPYYLHTSPEYHMKRLLAAGFPDLYQICKVYRDGELGARHLAEFTLVEWYRRQMSFEAIIAETCEFVTLIAQCWERSLPPASRHSYRDLFLESVALDPLESGLDDIRRRATELLPGVVSGRLRDSLGDDRAAWLDLLLVGIIEPGLRSRGLVIVDRYPAGQAALARLDPSDPRAAERFEVYLDGIELANGYHELADAAEQRGRFEADRRGRARQGLPDTPPDTALLAALEAGLPDCCGVALGFDRLLMACAGLTRITEVVSFATPEDG
jgi:elongation factor P--(R)-beta-lysine ligase